MERITVTIPYQNDYDPYIYMGVDGPCYLERELITLLPESEIAVLGLGKTIIDGIIYIPTTETFFDGEICREAFDNKQDITVTLVKQS